jgi:hypothetical protein
MHDVNIRTRELHEVSPMELPGLCVLSSVLCALWNCPSHLIRLSDVSTSRFTQPQFLSHQRHMISTLHDLQSFLDYFLGHSCSEMPTPNPNEWMYVCDSVYMYIVILQQPCSQEFLIQINQVSMRHASVAPQMLRNI